MRWWWQWRTRVALRKIALWQAEIIKIQGYLWDMQNSIGRVQAIAQKLRDGLDPPEGRHHPKGGRINE